MSKKITIEIPGTFSDIELNRISTARLTGRTLGEVDRFADNGAQLYLSFKDEPELLDRVFGLPLVREVTQETYEDLKKIAENPEFDQCKDCA